MNSKDYINRTNIVIALIVSAILLTLKLIPLFFPSKESNTTIPVPTFNNNNTNTNTVFVPTPNTNRDSSLSRFPNDKKYRVIRFSGDVYDYDSQKPLSGVNVKFDTVSISTDDSGHFSSSYKTSKTNKNKGKIFFSLKNFIEDYRIFYYEDKRFGKIYLKHIK